MPLDRICVVHYYAESHDDLRTLSGNLFDGQVSTMTFTDHFTEAEPKKGVQAQSITGVQFEKPV